MNGRSVIPGHGWMHACVRACVYFQYTLHEVSEISLPRISAVLKHYPLQQYDEYFMCLSDPKIHISTYIYTGIQYSSTTRRFAFYTGDAGVAPPVAPQPLFLFETAGKKTSGGELREKRSYHV